MCVKLIILAHLLNIFKGLHRRSKHRTEYIYSAYIGFWNFHGRILKMFQEVQMVQKAEIKR